MLNHKIHEKYEINKLRLKKFFLLKSFFVLLVLFVVKVNI